MQEYDVALKLLLRGSAKLTMRELTGTAVETWLDVELSKVVQNTRVCKQTFRPGSLNMLNPCKEEAEGE